MTVAFCGGMGGCYAQYGRKLYELMRELTEEHGALRLLLAGEGNFDYFVLRVLRKFQWEHPLAQAIRVAESPQGENSLFDGEIALCAHDPAVFAFAEGARDAFMARECDIAVTCSVYDTRRIARFRAMLEWEGKELINLREGR